MEGNSHHGLPSDLCMKLVVIVAMKVVSSVVPWRLDPTPANAMHLLRFSLCCRLVGPAMAAQANRLILAEISDVPVHLFSETVN